MIRVGAAAFALLVLGKRCVRRAGTNSGGATHAAKEHDMLVDVGGHKLEVVSAGTKGPTVVLESGFGATSDFWEKVQHGASEFVAQELHSALHAGQFAPPNVLVGHSIGSFYIRVFANTYPREVCGMVFVDPVSEDFYEWMRTHQPEDWKQMEAASSQLPEGLRNELARKERRASPTGMAPAEGSDYSNHSDETNCRHTLRPCRSKSPLGPRKSGNRKGFGLVRTSAISAKGPPSSFVQHGACAPS